MENIEDLLRLASNGDESAARKLKHLSKSTPEAFHRIKGRLLRAAMRENDLRIRWNLIVVAGNLQLKGRQRAAAIDWLFERLEDESSFTRTFTLQALWNLSESDPDLRARVREAARHFANQGTAAMQARARKLLKTPTQ